MELTVLGSYGPWPGVGGGSSGYLLRQDGFTLWTELGSGTLGRLQEHVPVSRIDALFVSHAHPDHFVELYSLLFARLVDEESGPGLPLYTPPGLFDVVARLVSPDTGELMRRVFDVREVEPGRTFEAGPFRVETRAMTHLVPTLGIRVEAGGAALAFTGDTGPTEEVVALARDAAVLMAEATWQDHDNLQWFHLSARQAGEHAEKAGVERLILTHTYPNRDRETSRAQAAEAFGGDVLLAEEGLRLEVGP